MKKNIFDNFSNLITITMLQICFWCLDMENEIVIHNENDLRSKIYTIRGMQVMLDFDLAEIYGYTTKRFNEQVKNNIEKFDEDFRFQLNAEEVMELSRSKISTSIQVKGIKRGRVYFPYAFTEQGIYMLTFALLLLFEVQFLHLFIGCSVNFAS